MKFIGTIWRLAVIATIAVVMVRGVSAIGSGQSARFNLSDGRVVATGIGKIASTPEGETFAIRADRSAMGILSGAPFSQGLPPGVSEVEALSADSGFLYFIEGNLIKVVDRADGQVVRQMPVPSTGSVASLANGRLVVGAPASGNRIHLYTKFGARLRSFGQWSAATGSAPQNQFLNRGLVATYKKQIAFAYSTSLSPRVEIWNERGDFVRSFEVGSDTLVRQRAAAESIALSLAPGTVGGQVLLTALAVDRQSGSIWVAMNGGDGEVNLQEYARSGELIAEYSVVSPTSGHALPEISSIVVRGRTLQLLSGFDVVEYRLPSRPLAGLLGGRLDLLLTKVMTASPISVAYAQGPGCEPEAPLPGTCTSGACSVGGAKDCKATLMASISATYFVTSNCTNSGTSCSMSVTSCTNGTNIPHGPVSLTCPKDADADGYAEDAARFSVSISTAGSFVMSFGISHSKKFIPELL